MSKGADLLFDSFLTNSMVMVIPNKDVDLIISGKKTVLIQRKLPSKDVIRSSLFFQRYPKVYLYNKGVGIFGECNCKLSYNNVQYESNGSNFIRFTPEINLEGTCLDNDKELKQVDFGKFIFFKMINLILYDKNLSIDDFHLARIGKNGFFQPSEAFKMPRGWCYAIKKQHQ